MRRENSPRHGAVTARTVVGMSQETTPTAGALAERLFDATLGALELFSVHLGWTLGLYQVLHDAGPMTAPKLAAAAGIDPRYAREWLEQQAVAGFLVADDVPDADERLYTLPAEHVAVFTDPDSAEHVAPLGSMLAGIGAALPAVLEAYRSGGGVPYAAYGEAFRRGQGAINRPAFRSDLAGWLAAVEDIHARLRAHPPARVADLGCGHGWSTVSIARAYPNVRVEGVDLDAASVAEAAALLAGDPVAARVGYRVGDASELAASGPYDLVCIFEALHDMAAPMETLAQARAALAEGGSVFVCDERVADVFTAPGDPVERLMYGWSVVHCLPASRAEQPSAALGTALRASTVVELGRAAGFGRVEVLPIDHDWFRFYRLSG